MKPTMGKVAKKIESELQAIRPDPPVCNYAAHICSCDEIELEVINRELYSHSIAVPTRDVPQAAFIWLRAACKADPSLFAEVRRFFNVMAEEIVSEAVKQKEPT